MAVTPPPIQPEVGPQWVGKLDSPGLEPCQQTEHGCYWQKPRCGGHLLSMALTMSLSSSETFHGPQRPV